MEKNKPASWSPGDTPDDVISKARSEDSPPAAPAAPPPPPAPAPAAVKSTPAKAEAKECPVDGCSSRVIHLERHIYDRANAGDKAHLDYRKSKGLKSPVSAQGDGSALRPEVLPPAQGVFDVETGRFTVLLVLGLLGQKMGEKGRNLKVPNSGSLDFGTPGSAWIQKAAEAHQKVMEKYLGSTVSKHGELIQLVSVWGSLFMVNGAVIPDANSTHGTDNRSEEKGKNVPGKVVVKGRKKDPVPRSTTPAA